MKNPIKRRNTILNICARRGITVYELSGQARRLIGPGVDLTVSDLADLKTDELDPPTSRNDTSLAHSANRLEAAAKRQQPANQ